MWKQCWESEDEKKYEAGESRIRWDGISFEFSSSPGADCFDQLSRPKPSFEFFVEFHTDAGAQISPALNFSIVVEISIDAVPYEVKDSI